MQFNFFAWIREGVRRSVILGVNDAVESLGAPPEDETWKDRVGRLLEHSGPPLATASALAGGKKKRLGRSLKDFTPGE
jgi:hypothetical protein